MRSRTIRLPKASLAAFCRRNHVRRLSLFGSALRPDFGPRSDIDLLVEFMRGHVPGLLGMARMEAELSEMLGGRKVDLRTPGDLSPYFREKVLAEAETQFAGA